MKGFGIEIRNELLEKKHIDRMGVAVWLYMWMIDKMTSVSEEGIGLVLGGKPIKFEEVEEELGISVATYRRWVSQLEKWGYIRYIRTPYGLRMEVTKAKKTFSNKDISKVRHHKINSDTSHDENDTSNKTLQLDNTVDTNINKLILGESPEEYEKIDKRNPDIQEGIDLLKELYGSISKENLNRFALKRLYAAKGKERVFKAIRFAHFMREDQYCPGIFNYMDLESKWNNLETYGAKLSRERNKESKVAVYPGKL